MIPRANATIDLRHADGSQVTQVSPGTWTIQVTDETGSHNAASSLRTALTRVETA